MIDPIRIFIGTSSNNEDSDAEMVLEYTLKKNTTHPLEITWMRQTHDTDSIWGGWETDRWSTPFSGFRWAIPEACDFSGRAIYMDVDQLNLRDISDLYATDLRGRAMAARRGARLRGAGGRTRRRHRPSCRKRSWASGDRWFRRAGRGRSRTVQRQRLRRRGVGPGSSRT